MCGFVAVIDPGGVDVTRLGRQTDALEHRGPDGRGIWTSADGKVGLGSRRLAIVDLSPRGHMPMIADEGRVAIAFNGEIYNFRSLREELTVRGRRFQSETDTEVVLLGYLEWGEKIVERLDGMFGFALYDGRKVGDCRLLIARDRAGEKPVQFYEYGGRVIVASELSAILEDERVVREICPVALDALLAFGYVPGDKSLVRRVKKLLPGNKMWIGVRSASFVAERYWAPPTSLMQSGSGSGEELGDATFKLLKASVRRQLVADVPIGVFLSGGLDSSLITAAAAEVSDKRIKTFTVGFPGSDTFDETRHAQIVARHFDTEHHVLDFSGDLLDEFQFLADRIDEPTGDSSILPTSMVSRFARSEVAVALGGDGGDELFGGYSTYPMLSEYRRQRKLLPGMLRSLVSTVGSQFAIGTPGRSRLSALRGDVPSAFVERSVVFNRWDRRKLLSSDLRVACALQIGAEEWRRALWRENGSSDEEAAMQLDFSSYLPDDVLTKVDRASMLHSLEVRAPFLSRDVIEFAFSSVPIGEKVGSGRTKLILKKIASRVLPPELEIERKQGFSVPGKFFSSIRWQSYACDGLASLPRTWFDQREIAHLQRLVRRQPAAGAYTFVLVLLAHWQSRWGIQ